MASIKIEITERELRTLVINHFSNKLGDVNFTEKDVRILVKSKQNFKSEWEEAAFKATLEVRI